MGAIRYGLSMAPDAATSFFNAVSSVIPSLGLTLVDSIATGVMFQSQTDPNTVILAFADSLQSSAPVYIKIVPMIGGGTTPNLIFQTQIGTRYLGGGVLGGQLSPVFSHSPVDNYPAFPQDMYISAAPNRLAFSCADGPEIFESIGLFVERTKDTNGNDTSEGIIVTAMTGFLYYTYSRLDYGPDHIVTMVIPFGGTIAGYNNKFIVAGNTQVNSMAVGNKIGVLEIVHFNFRSYLPGYNLMVYYGSDYPLYSPEPIVQTDGVSHTYLPLQQKINTSYFSPAINGHLLMRYE